MDKHEYVRRVHEGKACFYRIAYSYVKNEHDALDIVGEAVYKALRELKYLREERYFKSWFTRIIINCALDYLRRSSRLTYLDDSFPQIWESVDESDITPEDSLDLYSALEVLGERERTCVTLRYFEDYSYSEIADIIGEPVGTVKSRIYRALEKMRIYYEKGEMS